MNKYTLVQSKASYPQYAHPADICFVYDLDNWFKAVDNGALTPDDITVLLTGWGGNIYWQRVSDSGGGGGGSNSQSATGVATTNGEITYSELGKAPDELDGATLIVWSASGIIQSGTLVNVPASDKFTNANILIGDRIGIQYYL